MKSNVRVGLWIGLATIMLAPASAGAVELENSRTQATSGTNGTETQGRASGANLSAGQSGPASETTMPAVPPTTAGAGHNPAQAGATDTTKELFQH